MTSDLYEEQRLPRYKKRQYYPLHIGQRLADRYRVITKLGFGAYSTVWLAKDERTNNYVSIKVFVQDDMPNESPVANEIKSLVHMKSCPQEHPGALIARIPLDMFQIEGPKGSHHCVSFKPNGCNLGTLRHMFQKQRLPPFLVSMYVHQLLGCVNWLVLDCNLIHAEITTANVLAGIGSDEQFSAIEQDEESDPSEPMFDNGYPIYPSRGAMMRLDCMNGTPCLTDFGSARSATAENTDWWMPDTYRAPEILMGTPWGCQVDIWAIGIMAHKALELVEGRNLFDPIDHTNCQYVLPLALAQYISVLGNPPLWMIEKSNIPEMSTYFDDQGRWVSTPPIPPFSLENWVTAIPEGEEKDHFLDFMRKVLVWDGMERAVSSDLMYHPWLYSLRSE